MKRFLLFFVFLLFFFIAGLFFDAVFHFWGIFTDIAVLWFFILVSYRLKPYEILYAGAFIGLLQSFFAVGPIWFWFSVFTAFSFVMMAAHFFIGGSGRFKLFLFSFVGLVGTLLVRLMGIFFVGMRYPGYGTVWDYIFSSFFGWEIGLSMAFLLCIGVGTYYTHRSERTYYV